MDAEARMVGDEGAQRVTEALMQQGNPSDVIGKLREEGQLQMFGMKHVASFLNLLGLQQREVNSCVLDLIRQELLDAIPHLTDDASTRLLDRCLPFVHIKEIQSVPIALLCRYKTVPDVYLDQLANLPQHLAHVPLKIRQQVWLKHLDVFSAYVAETVARYLEQYDALDIYTALLSNDVDYMLALRSRRSSNHMLQELVEAVGEQRELYLAVAQEIRIQFAATENYACCTLRMEVLMAVHEKRVLDLASLDPCYYFAWSLDASILDSRVEERRLGQLMSTFSRIAKEQQEEAIGDLAMIAGSPLAMNVILNEIYRCLDTVAREEQLPRSNSQLLFYSSLLVLGSASYRTVNSRKSKMPKLGKVMFTTFYPLMVQLLVMQKHQHFPKAVNEVLSEVLEEDKAAVQRIVLCFFFLKSLQLNHTTIVEQLAPVMGNLLTIPMDKDSRKARNRFLGWLHRFVFSIVTTLEVAQTEATTKICINNVLLSLAQHHMLPLAALCRYHQKHTERCAPYLSKESLSELSNTASVSETDFGRHNAHAVLQYLHTNDISSTNGTNKEI